MPDEESELEWPGGIILPDRADEEFVRAREEFVDAILKAEKESRYRALAFGIAATALLLALVTFTVASVSTSAIQTLLPAVSVVASLVAVAVRLVTKAEAPSEKKASRSVADRAWNDTLVAHGRETVIGPGHG